MSLEHASHGIGYREDSAVEFYRDFKEWFGMPIIDADVQTKTEASRKRERYDSLLFAAREAEKALEKCSDEIDLTRECTKAIDAALCHLREHTAGVS